MSLAIFLSIGGLAMGGCAFGGLAVGVISVGGAAAGLYAFGGAVWGLHALGGNSTAEDLEASRFFLPWALNWWKWLTGMSILAPIVAGAISLVSWLALRSGMEKPDRIA